MIIAIDGPAGAGKSTVARLIAQKLGFLYIDTGAMYRALTLQALDTGVDVADTAKVVELAKRTAIKLSNNPNGTVKVLLDGRDVSAAIRLPRVTAHVSDLAKIKEVREVMLAIQRSLGRSSDSVLDGRDIGTVVFPDADRKFFIDADFRERARRRFKELKAAGEAVTLEQIESDLANRDKIDTGRKVAPLRKAEDAIYIDTTNMSIEEVVDKALRECNY
jgi:cytidylate kinase